MLFFTFVRILLAFSDLAHNLGTQFFRDLFPGFGQYLAGAGSLPIFLLLSFFLEASSLLGVAPARERRGAHQFRPLGWWDIAPTVPAADTPARGFSFAQIVVVRQFTHPVSRF